MSRPSIPDYLGQSLATGEQPVPPEARAQAEYMALVPAARDKLRQLLTDPDVSPQVALQAIREVNDRAFGKPMQTSKVEATADESALHLAALKMMIEAPNVHVTVSDKHAGTVSGITIDHEPR